MPPIKKITDQFTLVPTTAYPHAHFPFENFNPVQSRVFEFYDQNCSALVAARTSAGKTVVSELLGAHEIAQGGSFLYLCPLRALAQEKIDDWTSAAHHFGKRKIAICTGDYRLTPDRAKELAAAEVIIMTSEMLSHRARNYKSEQNNWLLNVKVCAVDESHLLTVPGRGDHLEVGLMKFTEINPQARLLFLSATMPNVEEIGEWISYVLTQKDTYVLRSNYRPCPLSIHYEKYDVGSNYTENEQNKVDYALDIVDYYPEDKFLIFAHTKRTGDMMVQGLKSGGIETYFHNADLGKDDRISLEKRFKEDKTLRCVVATSTLAWGCNMPARRVIILGVHRGLSDVETYDIDQMSGRAGRVGFDPAGDVYVLLPEKDFDKHKARLQNPQPIQSQLLANVNGKHKVLAFHLVSAIHHGDIQTKDDVHTWYERSLAYWQTRTTLSDKTVDDTLELLRKCFAIKYDEDLEVYEATAIGAIASMFYYSPFDVSNLRQNFKYLFEGHQESDDMRIAMALANTDGHRNNIVSRAEKEEMGTFAAKVWNAYGGQIPDPVIKSAFCYHLLMNGKNSQIFAGFMRGLQFDFNRTAQVLNALDSMSGKWGKQKWFGDLQNRIGYGVKTELTDIVRIPNVGKARATKLWAAGLKTVQDIADNPDKVKKATGLSKAKVEAIVAAAKNLALIS